MQATSSSIKDSPWIICFATALFFCFQFMQMNVFNAISFQLMNTFKINTVQLGHFSAVYLYAIALFFLPAGLLLDRFSTRKLILTAMIISILSTIMFATSDSLHTAKIARFLTGMVHGLAFLSGYRMVSRWLRHHMALAMGLITTVALMGGILMQAPLALLANAFGWRDVILMDAGLGVVIWIVMWIFVKDHPDSHRESTTGSSSFKFWKNLGRVAINLQNWGCAIYTALLNLPLILLGALWGNIYLTREEHLTNIHASEVITMIYIGTIIGSPLAGWISDRICRRKVPMITGAFLALLVILPIAFVGVLSFPVLIVLFFLLGLFTSTQSLTYPVITESNKTTLTSTATGFASVLIMGNAAIFQPFFGWLTQQQHVFFLSRLSADSYRAAFMIIPIAFLISLTLSLIIKETNCRRVD